jgi:CHAT domain-containing protein
LSSGRDLLRLQVKSAAIQPPVVVANPAFHELVTYDDAAANSSGNTRAIDFRKVSVDPLPETAVEAEAFKTIFPNAQMLTGSSATESTVKKVKAPSILHIATHGFFESDAATIIGTRSVAISGTDVSNTNPLLRSGLLLAGVSFGISGSKDEDGILTALEVTNLNLWGTKLVVLSACETGLGDVYVGEGVFGLRRALVLAGAESQVISLWKVSDLGTRELMTAYYNALKRGASRADALRMVQLKMIGGPRAKGRRFSHPFYWAGFIQSGDWRAM